MFIFQKQGAAFGLYSPTHESLKQSDFLRMGLMIHRKLSLFAKIKPIGRIVVSPDWLFQTRWAVNLMTCDGSSGSR
jgi:hypothetical protein